MLPDKCNPGLLALRGERLYGAFPASGLHRFRRAVDHAGSAVKVDLKFGLDDKGYASINGRLRARVRLTCQRCLDPLDRHLEVAVDLLVVHSDQEAEQLTQDAEVLRISGDTLSLPEMLEDELLLALPRYPMHAPGRCAVPASLASAVPSVSATASTNPFDVLKNLEIPVH